MTTAQVYRDRSASTARERERLQAEARSSRRVAVFVWSVWTATAVLAWAGVMANIAGRHTAGVALQLGGLAMAVAGWAFEECRRRHG